MKTPHIIKPYLRSLLFMFPAILLVSGCGEDLKHMQAEQAKRLEKTALIAHQQKAPTAEEKHKSAQALEILHRAAAKKNVFAEYYLGQYAIHTGDKDQASTLIQQAATQNDPAAEFLLSMMYQKGFGTIPNDPKKEAFWLEKSANSGYPRAELLFAVAAIKGTLGIKTDPHTAFMFMRKAAHADIPAAQYLLFIMYENGTDGAPVDKDKATYWAQKVEHGHSKYAEIVKHAIAERALVAHEEATNSGPATGRYTTDCDNMSCVRRYSNGAIIHFTACMNPADMEPMDDAPVVDGQGGCSGTDAEGNFYGMGSFN